MQMQEKVRFFTPGWENKMVGGGGVGKTGSERSRPGLTSSIIPLLPS